MKNTLFWQPHRAMLLQDGKVVLDLPLTGENFAPITENLSAILARFLSYTEPAISDWGRATEEFRDRVAELGRSLREVIQRARGTVGTVPNRKFVAAFDGFATLCRAAINPGLADAAIEEMLIQHLLTARLFGSIFKNPDFIRRNVVASEIEKVIDALASGHFTRADFLKKLDRFYLAIESAAETIEDFSEKQKFLNTVYEKFFQGFAVKVADTMGIVYTPPSIVRFMIASVQELLQKEFGKGLGDPGVHVIDPFTGTGNFVVHLMRELPAGALKRKFASELWANEIMLLPYYIAAQNIEHEYFEKTGTYEPFPGLCLVDTFELAEPQRQTEMEFLSVANTERVNAQRRAPVFVVIGNPPYRGTQKSENDNNKNRKYPTLDDRVAETYVDASKATLRNKVAGDPYIRALRWSSDRIGEHGIVSLVIPHSWIRKNSFDGVRAHLAQDFDHIYVVDLGGSVIDNPQLSGTTHNVFGIPMGVCIAHFVRKPRVSSKSRKAAIEYFAVTDDWRKEKKLVWLETTRSVSGVSWTKLKPDLKNTWLTAGLRGDFDDFLPLGSKEAKALDSLDAQTIFRTYSLGVSTNRDSVVYDFDHERLSKRVSNFADDYNSEVSRYERKKPASDELDAFLKTERIKWSRNLKSEVKRGKFLEFDKTKIRLVRYRPFTSKSLYLDDIAVDEPAQSRVFSPAAIAQAPAITLSDIGHRADFTTLMVDGVYDLHLCASSDAFQSFPLYTYDADGGHRRDNVTDWALDQFNAQYPKAKITKKGIFHYVYAVLHHPAYREKYAANLRRELPRIPFAPDFAAFAKAGEKLATLHTGYESQKEFKLKRVESGKKPDWRVEKMKLSKDKTALIYNDWLTLEGIPEAAHTYRLGNRSALDWVVDQYQIERSKENPDEILSDPNRPDDEEYIVRLIGQVVTVSVETMKIISALPALGDGASKSEYTQADLDAAHIYVAERSPGAT